jgi:hypothetical protein
LNPRPREAQLEYQNPRKAQEDYLEEEKPAMLTKDMKSGKPKQNSKEEIRKVQNHKAHKTQKLPMNQFPL